MIHEMLTDVWLPWYDKMRQRFGYSVVEDQSSAQLLSELLSNRSSSLERVKELIDNKNVLVVGAGPSLEDSIATIRSLKSFTIIVADGTSRALLENNVNPDIVITDLDGNHDYLLQADKMGSIMVVHAHGDNTNLQRNLVPKMRNCVGTTQVKPLLNVYNFGGFTDGDRGVFLANELGAKNIVLVGMDFGNKIGRYSKDKVANEKLKIEKMEMARQLLEWLATWSKSKLYNASPSNIKGFQKIALTEIANIK